MVSLDTSQKPVIISRRCEGARESRQERLLHRASVKLLDRSSRACYNFASIVGSAVVRVPRGFVRDVSEFLDK